MLRLWILIFMLGFTLPTGGLQAAIPVPVQKAQDQAAGSPSEAAAIAVRRHGGEVLKVQKAGKHYKVRLLTADGRVKEVKVAAK
ncbi:PepSY domain-containing protein [Simiduia agarivorans]|uniref:PepSY domain-containing protein n=1 Tax=Simiduia agarivorans (strain DSM 21679 / JCM 13881 / BCRC 17597 / SA1) TaxID=1117647 RepID=K4KFX8_SIMAS|nr:hypothetical protein [Simiduia agarivorans]AFU97984.1 hypothetical protein M5M_03875 [Simiduia agarivorans SA1 = DSM 21679]